ncbi:hypothetical protein CONLIGDRAFT_370266 [Coniochaeta ligniaria NRRL 30616]|uniref:Uncharacterized protein n=1 Tax=Coniochaeta ligniaria NRRL 30616 TaxID=1408157 RepID=A0A1J7J4L7_9PEZI|nr:hypothetical protein CONLIGDRAFT_370266 [Coniochaeta ligniaria NRRL 30616]
MAETVQTPAEPQRPAQPHAPQPVLEKMPLQNQQAMQFVPYTPGQQQQPLLKSPGDDVERPFSRPWHIAKIVLGSASLVVSIVIWAISIVLLARYTSYDYNYDSWEITFEAAFALAAAGIAVIWQAAEFITVWASKTNRGIHPGANVALHLIIWLVAILGVGFLATFVAYDVENLDEIRNDSDSSRYSYSYYNALDADSLAALLGLEEALLAFMSLLFLLHFVLFVRACVETHQYNNHPVTRTVYVQVPVQMAGGAPGQQPFGYYAYQPLPGQPLPFAQPQSQVPGAPVATPQQAHLYGYYAPAPAFPPQVPQDNRMSTVSGSSHAAPGRHGPSTGTVSPVTSSDRQ